MPHDTSHLTSVGKLPRRSLHPAPSHHQRTVLVQPVRHPHLPADQTASALPAAGHPTPRTLALLWAGRVVGATRKDTLRPCARTHQHSRSIQPVWHTSL